MQAKKILHITTVPQSLNFVRGLIGYLKIKGFEVDVLSSPGDLLDQFSETAQVKAYAVEMPRRITPLHDILAILKIWQILRRTKPTIVHAHTPKGGLLGITGAWLAGIPIRIYHIHGLPLVTAKGYKRMLLRWSEKVSCLLASQVLCVSHSIQEVAIQEKLCSPTKIKVLLNGSIGGIDAINLFNPQQRSGAVQQEIRTRYNIPVAASVLGFVGRIVRDKGIIELISAWRELREEFSDLHLLMVGPFESQDPVPPEVEQQLRNDPRIHLIGWVADHLAPYYAIMKICVLPTYREGFPVSPLEAAAMGIPVVATQIPGCVDAVEDGVTGTLVPPRDAQALKDAIRHYLIDADLRRKHGAVGRERVLRDFKPEDIWEATYQEYVRLLEKHHV